MEKIKIHRLHQKTVVITGGSQGIGLAITRAFLVEGAKVLNIDIKIPPKDLLSQKDYIYISGDISLKENCRLAIEKTIAEFGKISVLVNNAAISFPGYTDDPNSLKLWDAVINTNLTGTFQMIHFALPYLKKTAEASSILNIASIGSEVINPAIHPSYAASKGAINSLTRFLAAAYAKYNIRCNSISPAAVKTELWDALPSTVQNEYALLHPLGVGEPEDIANLAVFLCSNEAKWISGANYLIDGGYLCSGGLAQQAKEKF